MYQMNASCEIEKNVKKSIWVSVIVIQKKKVYHHNNILSL